MRCDERAGGSTTSGSGVCGETRACASCTPNARTRYAASLHVGGFCPIQPNVLWALDFQFDQTADAQTLKLLNVIDEHTRECPAIVVDRSIDADKVVATLERLGAGFALLHFTASRRGWQLRGV